MGSPWSSLGSWTPHTDQACTHLLRPARGPSDRGSVRNEGCSAFCRDGGEGRPGLGGRAVPCPVSVPAQGLRWSPSRGQLSLRSDGARPPSVAAAAEAATPASASWGQGASSPPCSLFSSSATQKEKKKKKFKKKKGSNCSEMIQSFLQKCLLSSRREGAPPRPAEKISSVFSGPAWPPLSPGSPT